MFSLLYITVLNIFIIKNTSQTKIKRHMLCFQGYHTWFCSENDRGRRERR